VTSAEHGQASYSLRLDWGPAGAQALVADARPGDVAVVVDVLSFTTTLSVALERGIAVYPYPWRDDGAEAYAAERGAVLAAGRREALRSGAVSLSPASLSDAVGIERVVLPSPNGSSISFGLASSGLRVVGACLRNSAAVGGWLRSLGGGRTLVVAAGERWPDGSLRPAVEDLWGAGAVLAQLDLGTASPEAAAAVAAYGAVREHLSAALRDCASGRELVAAGFARDVEIAGQADVIDVVPLLAGDRFGPATQDV
jgi:2-phosphosulfolactate phosphatase